MEYQFNLAFSMPGGWEDVAASASAKAVGTSLLAAIALLTQGYRGGTYVNIGTEPDQRVYVPVAVDIVIPGADTLPIPSATLQGTDGILVTWAGAASRSAGLKITSTSSASQVTWFVNDSGTESVSTGSYAPQMLTDVLQSGWLSGTGSLPSSVTTALNPGPEEG